MHDSATRTNGDGTMATTRLSALPGSDGTAPRQDADAARDDERPATSAPVVLDLSYRRNVLRARRWRERLARRAWRGANVLAAATALVLLSPLLLVVAVAVKLDSRGPVLYRQERVGRTRGTADGLRRPEKRLGESELNTFTLYKFRSMTVDAEDGTGPVWASSDDARVTRVGRWLRRLHLDELPQLWNVVVGDMNLVGPRPERPPFVRRLDRMVPLYSQRLLVRPGLTGLAQIRHRSDENLDDVRRKLAHDLEYLRKRSVRLDLEILLRTPGAVLRRVARTARRSTVRRRAA